MPQSGQTWSILRYFIAVTCASLNLNHGAMRLRFSTTASGVLVRTRAFAVRTVVLRDTIGCDANGENCSSSASDGQAGA